MQVAFYKGRDRLFNQLVSWYLRGPYSHVEMVLATDAAGVSQCLSSSFMDGGVRCKFMALAPDHWDLVEIADAPDALQWLIEHETEGYDLLGLIGFVWRRQKQDRQKWFCSEAVAAMLGWREPWRFDPMALAQVLKGVYPQP